MKKKKQIDIFFEQIKEKENFFFFVDDYNDVYVQTDKGIYNIRSETYLNYLLQLFFDLYGYTIPIDTLKNNINFLPIYFNTKITDILHFELNTRVGSVGNSIFYDLAHDNKIVEINSNNWKITDQITPIFRPNNCQKKQVEPLPADCFEDFFNFINIKSDDMVLFAVTVISYFIPNIAHPILMFSGKPGTAKTTTHALIKSLVDPTIVGQQKIPASDKDLLLQWRNQWLLFYDNVSSISSTLSDTFCRGITGEGTSTRKLYTDIDEIYYNIRRCFLINGIDQPGTKPDLMQRTILIDLNAIPPKKRKTEKEIFSEFNKIKPQLLGSIFNIISRAITLKENITLPNLPRMADFALWGEAISRAIGYPSNQFYNDFYARQEKQETETAEFDPLYNAITAIIGSFENNTISGTSAEILKIIKNDTSYDQRKYLPYSSGSFGRRLNIMADIYQKNGLIIEKRIVHGKNQYTITQKQQDIF